MSVLDNIEKSRVDVRTAYPDSDIVLCYSDKTPKDYLNCGDNYFRIYVQINRINRERAMKISRQIMEYLESVPCIGELSPGVLVDIPFGLTWTDSMYEQLVGLYKSHLSDNNDFKTYMLIISFRITGVKLFYQVYKLFLIFRNIGVYRFYNLEHPVLMWKDLNGSRRYIEINNSFFQRVGLQYGRDGYNYLSERVLYDLWTLCLRLDFKTIQSLVEPYIIKSSSRYWKKRFYRIREKTK